MEKPAMEANEGKTTGSEWSSQSTVGSQSQDGNLCTPTNRPRHKRLDSLASTGECRSPILKIPSSPVMERLGYGTGVGVFCLERSPRANGERSPWAIKKLQKMAVPKNGGKSSYETRLEFEAGLLKELNHPNIIGFRAYVKPSPLNDRAFLAMEKAPCSLADLTEARHDSAISNGEIDPEPFLASQIAKVAEDVARALAYLHDEKKITAWRY